MGTPTLLLNSIGQSKSQTWPRFNGREAEATSGWDELQDHNVNGMDIESDRKLEIFFQSTYHKYPRLQII